MYLIKIKYHNYESDYLTNNDIENIDSIIKDAIQPLTALDGLKGFNRINPIDAQGLETLTNTKLTTGIKIIEYGFIDT